ncbi:MAG TPA: hypothetical protein VEO96_08710 [Thermoplasmata archaeon]|nr:hypothetical protein [Thermoplasmata archaeon]
MDWGPTARSTILERGVAPPTLRAGFVGHLLLDFKYTRRIAIFVSCIEGLVRERAAEGEARLKQALGGFLVGGIVRAYLPQTWTILTEQESITIHADTQGNIRVLEGIVPTRDGDIKIGHDLLADGIQKGRSPPPGSYQVGFYTQKGRTAFGQLKSSFGL